MKVCHVISGYFRNDARVFTRQCLSLKDAGYEVSLLTNDGGEDEVLMGIKVHSCGQLWPRWRTLLFARLQFKQKALEIDADVYQLHSPELLPLGVELKKLGKKVVYDAHEDMQAHILEKDWLPTFSRKAISFLVSNYMRYGYKKIDQIVSPHSHVVKKISDEMDKGVLIANFPILKDLEDISLNAVSEKDPIICYSGTVYSYSNQEQIVESISSIPNVRYEVAGVIEEVHKNSLLKMSGGQKVVFHGRINQESLRDLYRRSLVGIVVYDYKLNLGYNLGSYGTNKLFEYMEAGLPVICTDYLLWKEIIEEYNCGFYVTPGDVDGIRRSIETIVGDRNLAYEMGRNSRRAALVRFNWESENSKYLEIFDRLNHSD